MHMYQYYVVEIFPKHMFNVQRTYKLKLGEGPVGKALTWRLGMQ